MQNIDLENGLSQYFVTPEGDVYWQYQSRFKLMTPRLNTKGYPYIQIGGHKKLVHRLVANAYLDKPDGCNVVNHLDENRTNNAVSNLEWTTQSGNMKHYYRNKRYKLHGYLNCNAKLNPEQVHTIKARLAVGESAVRIARDFLVGHTTIYNIKLGKSYL